MRVFRAQVLGQDALVKRYEVCGLLKKLKYVFRTSRGRRAFAASEGLTARGMPTPRPLGFLEVYDGLGPRRSYFITSFLTDACTVRSWIETRYGNLPEESRRAFRSALLRLLLNLYEHRVYHADTKTSNMLLQRPSDAGPWDVLWVDLECVRLGVRPGRRRIVRNLVQINGSLCPAVSDEDRLDFLKALSKTYPWAARPRVVRRIRRWTDWRLSRERRGIAGP